MLYPICIHQDNDSAYSATIPDFPGCFSAADEWKDLPAMIQEAIELYCDGEDMGIPQPSTLNQLEGNPDYKDGQWVFIDIDTNKLNTKAVRLNISLPANLVVRIDEHASALGMSRSGFLAKAADQALHDY